MHPNFSLLWQHSSFSSPYYMPYAAHMLYWIYFVAVQKQTHIRNTKINVLNRQHVPIRGRRPTNVYRFFLFPGMIVVTSAILEVPRPSKGWEPMKSSWQFCWAFLGWWVSVSFGTRIRFFVRTLYGFHVVSCKVRVGEMCCSPVFPMSIYWDVARITWWKRGQGKDWSAEKWWKERLKHTYERKLGGGFKHVLFSLWKIPILTSIFFKWVETTN